jgi:glycosyl transferase, family 25
MLPIRYINLERDIERRRQMETALSRTQLPFERFDAVNWPTLDTTAQDALYSATLNHKQFYKPLVAGEKGCYASHIALWQWLLASAYQAAIVLEDDVQPTEGFEAVCSAVSGLPASWDMIKLIGRSGLGKQEKLRSEVPLCPGHLLVQYRRIPSLTAGYALSREGARKLLANRVPFGRPIDVDIRHWWEGEPIDVLGVVPAAIALTEASTQSSIGQKMNEGRLSDKYRKFTHKLNYSLNNAWHAWRR